MEVKEIYEQLCLRVPVKQYDADPADFRGVLQRELKNYMFLVNLLKEKMAYQMILSTMWQGHARN